MEPEPSQVASISWFVSRDYQKQTGTLPYLLAPRASSSKAQKNIPPTCGAHQSVVFLEVVLPQGLLMSARATKTWEGGGGGAHH